jgi:hypothetical protein
MKVMLKKMFRWIRLPRVSWRRRRDSYNALDEDFIGYESFSLHCQDDTAAHNKKNNPTTLREHPKGM